VSFWQNYNVKDFIKFEAVNVRGEECGVKLRLRLRLRLRFLTLALTLAFLYLSILFLNLPALPGV
jgi:hypothetical protein